MAPVVALKVREPFAVGEARWRQPPARRHPTGQVYRFPPGVQEPAAVRAAPAPPPRPWPPLASLAFIVGASAALWGVVGMVIAALT